MASRLDAVLRVGAARKAANEGDDEGLTRRLKNTSLVPTGACMPRTFDPDYCAYDRYYTIGVALVSAALSALANNQTVNELGLAIQVALKEALGRQCHVPQPENPDGYILSAVPNPMAKPYHKMEHDEKHDASKDFSFLCKAMEETLGFATEPSQYEGMYRSQPLSFSKLVKPVFSMIMTPANMVTHFIGKMVDGGAQNAAYQESKGDARGYRLRMEQENYSHVSPGEFFGAYIQRMLRNFSIPWTLNYVSRYLNQHAMMIASFFRVNSKRLHTGEPLLIDISKFVDMCRKDIADGANPPPAPPTAEEIAAAKARVEAEKQRQADLVDDVMKMPTIMASYK